MTPAWFNLFVRPRYDWIQVEVTTHCQAACIYCPHTLYRGCWEERHLPLQVFKRLLPEFPRAGLVYLQGWGEPFLHPEFFTFITLARQAGCRVGTTTNGMHLDREALTRLVDLEVAVVAFSLAGVGEANDRVRRGTRFAQVVQVLETLQEIKRKKGAALPRVHVAYMLLRSGLEDLLRLPGELKGLGVSQVVVSTLDLVAAPEMVKESLRFASPEEYRDLWAQLNELADRGRRLGLEICHFLPPPGQKPKTCPENVGRAVCVAADGGISPCVYLNLAIQNCEWVTSDGKTAYRRLTFGSLTENPLEKLWNSQVYREWRREFAQGQPPVSCQGCLKLETAIWNTGKEIVEKIKYI